MIFHRTFGKVASAVLIGLAGTAFTGLAAAQSAKATFAYSNLINVKACNPAVTGCTDDTQWKTVLRQQIKLANQKDLFFNASLQCGIVTDTTVRSREGSLDISESRGTIRVRVKVTAPNGVTVTYAQPSTGSDAAGVPQGPNGGVVFCDRIQTLKAKFSGLNCTTDLVTGAVSCATDEELQLILKTLNANAFNFVAPNLTSGVHKIEVQARSTVLGTDVGIDGILNATSAFIGAGSVAVESVRMIKGNDGTTLPVPVSID